MTARKRVPKDKPPLIVTITTVVRYRTYGDDRNQAIMYAARNYRRSVVSSSGVRINSESVEVRRETEEDK